MPLQAFVEVELAGIGNGWTVLEDVLLDVPLNWTYGVDGSGITDRVAGSGTMTFGLDNSGSNSAGQLGLYSPGHVNCMSGWRMGIRIRLRLRYADLGDYFKFAGVIDSIDPDPGEFGERRCFVGAVDFMDEVARASVQGLPVQTNQRSDQLFSTLVAAMPKQPIALQVGYGMEQYAYALDGSRDEGVNVMTEFQKLAQSELGYVYVKGDPLSGGVLTFEDRRARGTALDPVATFDRFNLFDASRKRNAVINRVLVRVHPRRVDVPTDPFSPSDLASLTCWLKADAILGLNDGDPVSSWLDSSGLGNNFSNAAGTDRPTYKTGIANGKPIVRFDGINDDLDGPTAANLIASAVGTIFAVFRPTVSAGNVLGSAVSGAHISLAMQATPTRVRADNRSSGVTNNADVPSELAQWLIATWNHAGGQIRVGDRDTRDAALDLDAASSGNTDNLSNVMTIGSGNGTSFLSADVAELLFFNTALSEADRMNVESYLANKYMVTLPYAETGLGGISNRIFSLEEKPFIPRGTPYSFKALYKDEEQAAQRIGAISQRDPEQATDFLFNSLQDGTGTDLSGQISFDIDFGGNSADVVVTNNGPSDGYLVFMQLRGLGVYNEAEVVLEARDNALITEFGENLIPYDMPYQSDPAIALDAAYYILSLNKSEFTIPDRVGFMADQADDLMRHAILREISDRIRVVEPQTAIASDFFINSIDCRIDNEGKFVVLWRITPADVEVYWILDSDTQSQLDETTKLAYGLWNRFWILGVAAMGSDSRLSS